MEILDLCDYNWQRQITFGDIPDMGRSSFHTVIDNYLYLFGGSNDSGLCNGFYQLNLETFEWLHLKNQGTTVPAMASGGTVAFGTSIIFFGGIASVIKPDKYKGSFKVNESFGYKFDNGWHNYLHEYDTILSMLQ